MLPWQACVKRRFNPEVCSCIGMRPRKWHHLNENIPAGRVRLSDSTVEAGANLDISALDGHA
jgi:hypothetical protein